MSDFTFILSDKLSVDQPQKFSIFIIVEYGIMQCVCKMLKPQPVADRITVTDNCFRSLCSLRISFSLIVGKIFFIYNFLFRCHKTSQIQIVFPFPSLSLCDDGVNRNFHSGFLSFTLKFPARVRSPHGCSRCGRLRWKSSVQGFSPTSTSPSYSFH